jgi:predicted transcriptional regulator
MRTTIRLDDQLLTEAKRLALESGRTLTAVIEDAVREVVARRKETPKVKKTRLVTDGGRGLQPGVRLDNNAALLEIMEGRSGDTG